MGGGQMRWVVEGRYNGETVFWVFASYRLAGDMVANLQSAGWDWACACKKAAP